MKMPIFGKKHVMFDLETLSQVPGGVIVSIGACKFTFENGITDKFLINIDIESSKTIGLNIDKSTINWWLEQPAEVRNAWRKDPVPVRQAFGDFKDWLGDTSKTLIWSHGEFDKAFVSVANSKLGTEMPWKYWNEMCMRTTLNLVGANFKEYRTKNFPDGYHNALEDSIVQTNFLIELLM